MAGGMIWVDEESLNKLKNAIENAGVDYKNNLTKLENLINEITSGDIQGDPADDLLKKYQEKKEMFEGLRRTIDDAGQYVGAQTGKFNDMIGELQQGME